MARRPPGRSASTPARQNSIALFAYGPPPRLLAPLRVVDADNCDRNGGFEITRSNPFSPWNAAQSMSSPFASTNSMSCASLLSRVCGLTSQPTSEHLLGTRCFTARSSRPSPHEGSRIRISSDVGPMGQPSLVSRSSICSMSTGGVYHEPRRRRSSLFATDC